MARRTARCGRPTKSVLRSSGSATAPAGAPRGRVLQGPPTGSVRAGPRHVDLGGYHISDIEFTAAFDVTTDKVGKDLSEAIWAHPNDTYKFADVPKTGIKVSRGMTHDGIGKYMADVVNKASGPTDDVVRILQDTQTDVVVNYLPVGSEEATKWLARSRS